MDAAEFWATGDYAVVGDLWTQPGRDVAAWLPVEGRDVIDLATGTGVTAIAAAQCGARSVTGVDITPELLREAERRAEGAGVAVRWIEADLLSVPLPARSADLVTSTFGLVFAADPRAAVDEAVRLTRPGGWVVFTSWSASGLFGRIRQALAPYFPEAPAPWHESPEEIRALTGETSRVLEDSFVMTVRSPERFVGLLEQHSAPIIMGAAAIGDRWPEVRERLVALVAASGEEAAGAFHIPVGYLVTTMTVS